MKKIDLDALEAAHYKANLPDSVRILSVALQTLEGTDMDSNSGSEGYLEAAHSAIPALIAELRELRQRTTPEPISDKHNTENPNEKD